jgi:hypothetical protein
MDPITLETATVLLVIVTAGLVLITWYNAKLTKKAFQSGIILNLTEYYASDEMNEAMKALRKCWVDCEGNKEIFLRVYSDWKDTLDNYRRKISHHFLKIYLDCSDILDAILLHLDQLWNFAPYQPPHMTNCPNI